MGTRRSHALSAVVLSLLTAAVVAVGVLLQPPVADDSAARVVAPPPAAAETTTAPTDEPASPSPSEGPSATPAKTRTKQPQRPPAFDRKAHSLTRPTSPWVVVNKKHPLAVPDFRPEVRIVEGYQVAVPAAEPLARMLAAADRAGFDFKIASAFRSHDYQQRVYSDTVASWGQERADQLSARPGFSEHQTGLAVDLVTPSAPACDFRACFADTPAGQWLHDTCWQFGFVVRYPDDKTDVTGYTPEPWHLRWVGRPLAAEMRRTHASTLEEFFGVPGGDYS